MNWSTDIDAAKSRHEDNGQILADIGNGYYQVVTWDAKDKCFRENTNHLRLRNEPLRWKPINS